MSFDKHIDQTCPHFITGEVLTVFGNSNALRTAKPIANSNSVRVYLNGSVEVPSFGRYASAQTYGTNKGPYTVIEGVNDLLKFRVNGGLVEQVRCRAGVNLSLSDIVKSLSSQTAKVQFRDQGGVLGMATIQVGPDATLILDSGSTFATLMGLLINKQWRGREVTPGWALIQDLDRRNTNSRMIVFSSPILGLGDFFEVSYTTYQDTCPRCLGTGYENDWRYDSKGNTGEVREESLLIQELLKATFTEKTSNPFHPWYGTELVERIGSKIGSVGLIQSQIVRDVQTMFNRWQSIKKAQEEKVGQFVSDREFPLRLVSVDVKEMVDDPTIMIVSAVVQTRSLQEIELERGLRLPSESPTTGNIRESIINFSPAG